MADVTKFNLLNGAIESTIVTSEAQAAAATMTIDYTASKRVILYVANADAEATAYIAFTAPTTNILGGVQRGLGDLTIDVAAGSEIAIDLVETARYLNLTDKDIDVALVDSAGTALAGGVLSDITIRAINL